MGRKRLSLVGQRFGRLKVVADYGITGFHHTTWVCVCDCGEQKIVYGHRLTAGKLRSCGCLLRESQMRNLAKKDRTKRPHNFRHGHGSSFTATFATWVNMRQMCFNPKASSYPFYGARGISVCGRWVDSFDEFLTDMGEKPEGTMLSRIDKSRDFGPDNCEWKLKRTSRGKKLVFAGLQ